MPLKSGRVLVRCLTSEIETRCVRNVGCNRLREIISKYLGVTLDAIVKDHFEPNRAAAIQITMYYITQKTSPVFAQDPSKIQRLTVESMRNLYGTHVDTDSDENP